MLPPPAVLSIGAGFFGGSMAPGTARRPSEWERSQQAKAREAERARRAAAAAAKTAEKKRRDAHIARQKADVDAQNKSVEARVLELQSILAAGLGRTAKLDPASLKRVPTDPGFRPGRLGVASPQPLWEHFAPKPPGLLAAVFGGQKRYEQALAEAKETYRRECVRWEEAEKEREQQLAAAHESYEQRLEQARTEAKALNSRVERMVEGLPSRDKEAVEEYLGTVLARVPQPSSFPRRTEVAFSPRSEQAVVRVQLPAGDVVPSVRGYKYVQSRDEVQALPRPVKETGALYRSVVAQLALLYPRDLFDADDALDSVAFNGHVDAVNPATGQREYPCVISLSVHRSTFAELVLDQVRPEDCLKHLNALVSPHPYELEPVTPILDFDLTKYSFVEGLDAVSSLDSRPDLMQMSPTEFEHLVRQVFEAMGMEGWTTSHSHDDGVDAVMYNRTPVVGGLTIVQAKRYKNVVGVQHVRELAGAMEEKKAGRGILVTTSWFTSGIHEKARKHGRIELIDGANLAHLIKEHLGKEILIGINRPSRASG